MILNRFNHDVSFSFKEAYAYWIMFHLLLLIITITFMCDIQWLCS